MLNIFDHYYSEYLALIKKQTCVVCLQKQQAFVQVQNCKHKTCCKCVDNYLVCNIEAGCRRVEQFKCLQQGCHQTFPEVMLEKLLKFQYFNKLTNKIVFELSLLCPNCRTRCDFKSNQQLECQQCSIKICKFCKAIDHDGRCNTNNNYFKEVRAAIEDDELGYCPKCCTAFLKDQNCDHVTCNNPKCNFQFCFYCSVPFDPVNYHGGAFHRNDCRNFYEDDYELQYLNYEPECTECAKNQQQKVCGRPQFTREDYLKQLIESQK